MADIVAVARDYLAHNAAESGADVLIIELCEEIEALRAFIASQPSLTYHTTIQMPTV